MQNLRPHHRPIESVLEDPQVSSMHSKISETLLKGIAVSSVKTGLLASLGLSWQGGERKNVEEAHLRGLARKWPI